MPCTPEFPGYTRTTRSNHPTASGGQKASLIRAKDTSATSTPSTEGDRQEGGQLRPTRDRTRPNAGEGKRLPLPCRRRSPNLSTLLASRTTRVRPPRPASPSPPGNESPLSGTSTARTPHGSARIGRTPGGVGSVSLTPGPSPDLSGPKKPRADPGADFPGENFRGLVPGASSGGEVPGDDFWGKPWR